jgi:apolipoprotein D and lipocalin family protein
MRYLCLFLCLLATTSWAAFTPTTVAKVDLNRYMGKWYEVAKIPNTFQKTCDPRHHRNIQLISQ